MRGGPRDRLENGAPRLALAIALAIALALAIAPALALHTDAQAQAQAYLGTLVDGCCRRSAGYRGQGWVISVA
jgi:hypothetical protein